VTARHDLRWKTIAADAETASLRAISCFNRLFSQGKAVLVFVYLRCRDPDQGLASRWRM